MMVRDARFVAACRIPPAPPLFAASVFTPAASWISLLRRQVRLQAFQMAQITHNASLIGRPILFKPHQVAV